MTRVVTPRDTEWPSALDELGPAASPSRLYVDGGALSDMTPVIAIVGTRRPTVAGLATARRFAATFAEAGMTVVSGLAVGIDAAAHEGALAADGRTIAVLGCGLDVDYPRRNRVLKRRVVAHGALVSEHPDGTAPLKCNFPARNRIIAGLSGGVVIVEGSVRSGALITARHALDANRGVFAVPGSVRNPMAEGPNQLIRASHATLVTEPQHVLEELAPQLTWTTPVQPASLVKIPDLDPLQRRVLGAVDDTPAPAGVIARALEEPDGKVILSLAKLEVRGLVRKRSGGYALSDTGAAVRHLLPPPD